MAKSVRKPNMPSRRSKTLPPPPPDRWMHFLEWVERYSWPEISKNSYVISVFWAWFSRIELEPKVKIPVPRFLSYRDP